MEGFSRLGAIAVIGLMLPGCDDVASQAETESSDPGSLPPNQQAVEALIQKTMDNMVFVEGGSFEMGDFGPIDPKAEGLPYTTDTDNKPLHTVTLDSYSIAAYQVSYADYDVYSEATGQERINISGIEKDYRAPNVPAGVDWYQARDYCQWLSDQSGLPFSLPTEAQWEYAARSRGQFFPFSTKNGEYMKPGENFPTYDEIKDSTPANNIFSAYTIGMHPPNPLGIYQMGLNGLEWVSDWYDEDYYETSPEHNPLGPEAGSMKVQRGASFGEAGRARLVINRRKRNPDLSINDPKGNRTHSTSSPNTTRCIINMPDRL